MNACHYRVIFGNHTFLHLKNKKSIDSSVEILN